MDPVPYHILNRATDPNYVWEHHVCGVCSHFHIMALDGCISLEQVAVAERCATCGGWLLWCNSCAIDLSTS